MAGTTFLDTNVFMYAAGRPHAYKSPCLQILSEVEVRRCSAAVDTEVLQEILYRYSHIGLAEKGIQLCQELLSYPLTVLSVTETDIELAVRLFDSHRGTGLKPRDAVHAAVVRNNGISRVVSTDRHFFALTFVTRIDPLDFGRQT